MDFFSSVLHRTQLIRLDWCSLVMAWLPYFGDIHKPCGQRRGEGGFLKKPCQSTRGEGVLEAGPRGQNFLTNYNYTALNAFLLFEFGVFMRTITIWNFVKKMRPHMTKIAQKFAKNRKKLLSLEGGGPPKLHMVF